MTYTEALYARLEKEEALLIAFLEALKAKEGE